MIITKKELSTWTNDGLLLMNEQLKREYCTFDSSDRLKACKILVWVVDELTERGC